jgi:hypothetical protein
MDDFAAHLRTVTKWTLYILAVTLFVWAVSPDWRGFAAGFLLGGLTSLLNARYTAWKMDQLAEFAAKQGNDPNSSKRFNLGFVTRASTSLLAVLIAVRVENVEFATTIAGLFITQVLSLIVGILTHRKSV